MHYGDKYVSQVLITTHVDGLEKAMSSFCGDGVHMFKVWLRVEEVTKPSGYRDVFAGVLQFLSDGRVIFAPWDGDKDNPLKPA